MSEATNATRIAIECLTLWMEPGEEARRNAAEHISKLRHDPGGPGADPIIVGLLNLSMLLVLQLAKAEGADDIAKRAGEILRELSPQLPEHD
jgi:hypothetical protein